MIPFNKPSIVGRELDLIQEAVQRGQLSGDGTFTKHCNALICELTHAKSAFLTHSCTAALEMAAILCDLQPGDEVIMPSFTFVSTANAVVLRGAVPVFVDIELDTLNMDAAQVAEAVTPRTKAIFVVWSCRAYVPVPQLIYAAFRSNANGLLPPSDECLRRVL